MKKKILILGVNGFIGHHLTKRILDTTDWEVVGLDREGDRVLEFNDNQRFIFKKGDITKDLKWIESAIKKSDVVLPLVAIATPMSYVKEPLKTFELDFEANLPIVRMVAKYNKRLLFPSTSEVYGMSPDKEFHPYESTLVLGPIDKQRWIYSASKQLMDRVIWALGIEKGLDFTLFRPFNWIGAGLDRLSEKKEGGSRVITQFLGQLVRGENLKLVNGGLQKRSFTYIDDGIDALMKIIENKNGVASGKIYNIGNPKNNWTVKKLATEMKKLALKYPEYKETSKRSKIIISSIEGFYGKGYQDVKNRVPFIDNTMKELSWKPKVSMEVGLKKIFEFYRGEVSSAKALVDVK
jgi:nucleoside-diphosphate-sugar epimerase